MLPKDISVSSPAGTPHLSPMGSSGCSWQSSGQRRPSTLAPGDGNWVTSGGGGPGPGNLGIFGWFRGGGKLDLQIGYFFAAGDPLTM